MQLYIIPNRMCLMVEGLSRLTSHLLLDSIAEKCAESAGSTHVNALE